MQDGARSTMHLNVLLERQQPSISTRRFSIIAKTDFQLHPSCVTDVCWHNRHQSIPGRRFAFFIYKFEKERDRIHSFVSCLVVLVIVNQSLRLKPLLTHSTRSFLCCRWRCNSSRSHALSSRFPFDYRRSTDGHLVGYLSSNTRDLLLSRGWSLNWFDSKWMLRK